MKSCFFRILIGSTIGAFIGYSLAHNDSPVISTVTITAAICFFIGFFWPDNK